MLMRHDDLADAHCLAAAIPDRHLAFCIGPETRLLPGAARIGELLQNAVGVVDRRRHELRGFIAGIAEHDSLVARALILVADRIDAFGNIGGLAMQQDLDPGIAPVKPELLITDILDRAAGGRFDFFLSYASRSAIFAGNDDTVCRAHGFARDANITRINSRCFGLAIEQVDYFVGNPVAYLVGMTFRYGFTGKLKISARHRLTLTVELCVRREAPPMPKGDVIWQASTARSTGVSKRQSSN